MKETLATRSNIGHVYFEEYQFKSVLLSLFDASVCIFSLLHVLIILCIECEYVDVHLVFFLCGFSMGLDRVLLVSFQGGARLC